MVSTMARRDALYELSKDSPMYVPEPEANNLRCLVCQVQTGHDVDGHARGKKHNAALQKHLVCPTPEQFGGINLEAALAVANDMKAAKQETMKEKKVQPRK